MDEQIPAVFICWGYVSTPHATLLASFTETRNGCCRKLSELLQSLLVPSQKEMLRFILATQEYLEQRQGVAPSTAVDKVLALGATCSYYSRVH